MNEDKVPNQSLDLEKLRVGILYDQGTIAQTTGLINAGIYGFLVYEKAPLISLIAWECLMLSVFAFRGVVQYWFNNNFIKKNKAFDPKFWETVFAAGTLLSGMAWAIAGTLLLPADRVDIQMFLGFLLAGSTAGAAVAYCTSVPVILCFLLPAVLPYAAQVAFFGGSLRYAMALLIGLHVIMIYLLSKRMNQQVVKSIRLQFEKDDLLREQRETQSKITHAAKMAGLGIMAGGLAHEINNPLATINLETGRLRDIASKGAVPSDTAIGFSNEIDAAVLRAAKIILRLRSFAKDGKQDLPESVPVENILDETLGFCKLRFQNHGISLSIEPLAPGLNLICRRVQIGQAILSLLNNAFDAVEGQTRPWVKIEAFDHAGNIHIAVTDSGPGVSPENQTKIMQPFFTTKDVGRGTGLGLSMAHGIVAGHGGELFLDVNSRATRFVIRLPRLSADQVA